MKASNLVHLSSLALVVWAALPVKDFRTLDISTHNPDNIGLPNYTRAPSKAASPSVDFASLPVLQLTDSSFILNTDPTKSIYYLNVSVRDTASGYNPTFPLLLDTGSSISWIYNESCSVGQCADALRFSDPSASGLASASTFQLFYSGDLVSGDIVCTSNADTQLYMESTIDQEVELKNLTFGLANSSPAIFDGYNISGVVGIPSAQKNIIDDLFTQGVINAEQFLVILTTNNSMPVYSQRGAGSTPAEVAANFGGLLFLGEAANPFNGSSVTVDVIPNDNSYWMVAISDIETASQNSTVAIAASRSAIIDTGTTGILLPLADANTIHQQLFGLRSVADGYGNYAFPCSVHDAEIVFTTNDGSRLAISSSFFTGNAYNSTGLEGLCASKIQGTASGDNSTWILGAAFLSQYYTTFDLADKTIAFSSLNNASFVVSQAERDAASGSSSTTTSSWDSSTLTSSWVSSTSTQSATASAARTANSTSSNSSKNAAPAHQILLLVGVLPLVLVCCII